MVINKIKKEITGRKRSKKEQDYVVTSIVKEPSFLKKERSSDIEHKIKTPYALKDNKDTLSIKSHLTVKKNENKSSNLIYEQKEWKKSKKFFKSLNKSIKKLEWIKYNLKIKRKRLNNKNIPNLSQSIANTVNFIEDAINELKIGLSKTKKLPIRTDLNLYDNHDVEFRPKDVFETKIYLIQMNVKPESIANLVKMVFLRKNIVFLVDDNLNYLKETINDFFDSMFRNSFNNEVLPLIKTEFYEFKERHKNFVVISGKKILNDHGKEIYLKNGKFENKLVEIFFKNSDPHTGLKILRKELQEMYELSKEIRAFSELNENKLSRKKMLKHLEREFFLKIKKNYFNNLLDIVNDYFKKEIKFSEDYLEEKIDKMWR